MRFGLYLAVLLLAVATSAQAAVLHVPGQYPTIQDAVDAAGAGDSVVVAPGTFSDLYLPPGTDTTKTVVAMKSDISLIGAGIGQTFIDPDSLGRGIYCVNVTNAHIEGFTIRRAFAQLFGAGIYCREGSSPTITSCEIIDCGDGGIICKENASPDISYCDVNDNLSKQGGGIAAEDGSSPTIRHCNILRNAAPVGGGIFVRNNTSPVVIEDCFINENELDTANGSAGGVAIINAQMEMRRCEVNDNLSTGIAGGLFVQDQSIVTVEDTYIQNNETGGDQGPGGGVYCDFSDMVLDGCTITGNTCPIPVSDGGGVYIFFSTSTTISGCTIADNSISGAGPGAGVSVWFATPVIENTIIAFNNGGVGLHCGDDGNPNVSCTDIFGNSGGDDFCGTHSNQDNFSADPVFCDMAGGDFTLHMSSPCLGPNHPTGASCGLIGSQGVGCNEIGVPDPLGNTSLPPIRHFASPNPFGLSTTIHFGLNQPGTVWLAIYDVGGRRIQVLENQNLDAGRHERVWDGRDNAGQAVPSGVYFYQLGGDVPRQTGRIVLAR